jgi:predicted nucleotidyltransferase
MRSMALPQATQQALDQVVLNLKNTLKNNLDSCILYGSAVRGNHVPNISDINLLIVLNESTPEAHTAISDTLNAYPFIEPFILGKNGIERSIQSFAIKFRSISRNYRVLFGNDFLAKMTTDEILMRFLCEQSVRNLRLREVHCFVTEKNIQRYTSYLIDIIPDIFINLSETLRCKSIEVPKDYLNRIPIFEKEFGTKADILNRLLSVKSEQRILSSTEVAEFHSAIFNLLNQVISWIETQWHPIKTIS